MSMLSSCNLLSLAPPAVPAPVPGKFSPAALQLRTKQPAASPSAMALPRDAPRHKVSRALSLVCHAHTYAILPALAHLSVGDRINWRIYEDKDRITLEFDVGDKTTAADPRNLEVTTAKNESLNVYLVISYKSNGSDGSLATSLDARLLMPPGYDKKNVIKGESLGNGWLRIIIYKREQQTDNGIIPPERVENITQSSQNSKDDDTVSADSQK